MCLQETRYKFSKDVHEDGIIYRKVEYLGHRFHVYLQSVTGADSYNGMAIVSRRILGNVWKVSGNHLVSTSWSYNYSTSKIYVK